MKKFTLLLSLFLLCSCSAMKIVEIQEEQADLLTRYLHDNRQTPGEFLKEYVHKEESVVLYGRHGIRSDLELLYYLVPVLADQNSLTMGLWFLDGVDQSILDEFFSGESVAYAFRDLLFLSDPSRTGFQEYGEFLIYLKNFIISSPVELNWRISGISRLPEVEPFLLYVDTPAAEDSVFPGRKKILIHNPVNNEKGKILLPFSGSLYDLMIHSWPLYLYSGIPLDDSPFGNLSLLKKRKGDDIPVKQMYDGLILTGLHDICVPLTPIEGFINEDNTLEALKSFPDQLIRESVKPANYLMNLNISKTQKKLQKQLEKMSEILNENYPEL